jgi:ketosteroid isomerase-like protein
MGEPTDVLEKALVPLNDGDFDGFAAFHHEDAEMHDVPEIPGSTVYRGREGVREWAEMVFDLVGELRFEISEPVENGEFVLVKTRAIGKGRESSVEVDWTFWTLWGVRDGAIYYHHGYSDRDDALRALEAGL